MGQSDDQSYEQWKADGSVVAAVILECMRGEWPDDLKARFLVALQEYNEFEQRPQGERPDVVSVIAALRVERARRLAQGPTQP